MKPLRELAQDLLNRMMAEMEKGEDLAAPAIILLGYEDKAMFSAAPPSFGPMLDSGSAKDFFFARARMLCQYSGHKLTFGFATCAWLGEATEKGHRLQSEQPEIWKAKTDKGFVTLLAEGYIRRSEGVQATVQNPETVIIAKRSFGRSGTRFNWISEAEFMEIPQRLFAGRGKMYGDLREENLG